MIKNRQKKVAIIYEGEKTEDNLFRNLCHNFFADRAEMIIVTLPAAGNLYMLWTKLREDDFNTDVISVLKEMNCKVADRLKGIRAAEFAEVYLFFDYDGHHNNIPKSMGNLDALKEMLTTFNNETELGKLYVSYPMVESIKEISVQSQKYGTFYLPLQECSIYKETVGGPSDYSDFRYITKKMWYAACNASRKRASVIVSSREETDYGRFLQNISQSSIYDAQKERFIEENHAIGILNSVPLFLIEYFDETFWRKIQEA